MVRLSTSRKRPSFVPPSSKLRAGEKDVPTEEEKEFEGEVRKKGIIGSRVKNPLNLRIEVALVSA